MLDPQSDTLLHSRDAEMSTASVSLLAVVGLGLGIASLTALIHPVLWCVPVLAIAANVAALRRIDRYAPGLAGRPIAWLGLALALVAGVAAPTHIAVRDWFAATEAQRFATVFFDYLRNDEPQLAFQLTLEPEVRQPFDDRLWAKYRASSERTQALQEFVEKPTVRALLALGQRAQVRFFETERNQRRPTYEALMNVYAVTYTDDTGQPRSFFVRLALLRRKDANGEVGWYAQVAGPVRPANWPASAAP